jgi:hypothetical protein
MLKKITNLGAVVFILASMLAGFWIYSENPEPVTLVLFGFGFGKQPLGLLVIAVFALGITIGLFCNVLVTAWMAFRLKRLQKRIAELEKSPNMAGKL